MNRRVVIGTAGLSLMLVLITLSIVFAIWKTTVSSQNSPLLASGASVSLNAIEDSEFSVNVAKEDSGAKSSGEGTSFLNSLNGLTVGDLGMSDQGAEYLNAKGGFGAEEAVGGEGPSSLGSGDRSDQLPSGDAENGEPDKPILEKEWGPIT